MDTKDEYSTSDVAMELAIAVSRLQARMKHEAGIAERGHHRFAACHVEAAGYRGRTVGIDFGRVRTRIATGHHPAS